VATFIARNADVLEIRERPKMRISALRFLNLLARVDKGGYSKSYGAARRKFGGYTSSS